MPVGVNNEALGQNAIFGFDGTNYRVVGVDTAGKLLVALTFPATQEVTQDNPALLKATVNNTPRIPAGVTNLSANYVHSVADTQLVELFSNTYGANYAALSGRTIASGKQVCIAWAAATVPSTTNRVAMTIAYDSTEVFALTGSSPLALFSPSVLYILVGDGSKVWKVCAQNNTGGTLNTKITALCWEESV